MKILAAALVLLLAIGGISYVSAYNKGVQFEERLDKTWDSNKAIKSAFVRGVKEAAQVPDMMTQDLIKVAEATLSARYGEDGSKAMFQFLQEQNPNVSAEMYTKIQQMIESGRNKFANAQIELRDIKAAYNVELKSFYSGFWLSLAGHPKIDLSKYKVIVDASVAEEFETGIDEGINLN